MLKRDFLVTKRIFLDCIECGKTKMVDLDHESWYMEKDADVYFLLI